MEKKRPAEIELSGISLSDAVPPPGRPVVLSVDIRGENVGYVRLLVGCYDEQSNAIFLADSDYLEMDDSREIGGVHYPVWPEGEEFTMAFEREPLMFAISDGANSLMALLQPDE